MKKKILVVDDTSFIVMIVTKVLLGEDYNVITADSGKAALRLLQTETPDLILLDTALNDMSGFEVCQKLREDAKYTLVPIIMLCEQTSDEDKIKGIDMGADDYIIKPFDNREILARIRNSLIRIDRLRNLSPRTGLPTDTAVKSEVISRMQADKPCAALLIEINSFRPFSACYGLEKGEELLKRAAAIITESIREAGGHGDMPGHGAEGIFCVAAHPDRAVNIAERIIQRFDKDIIYHYSEEDSNKGFITLSSGGEEKTYGLAAISIGIAMIDGDKKISPLILYENAKRALKRAKEKGFSAFSE